MRTSAVVICFIIIPFIAAAQAAVRPEEGRAMPDFQLDNITHYSKKKASLKDFGGKWLVLDFWFTGCTTCIESFPKINSFQNKFHDQVQFVMIGKNDRKYNKGIEKLYEKFRVRQDLIMASAYDSILFERWAINATPHVIIVDPDGIVKAITDGRDMTMEKMQQLIDGEKVTFFSNERLKKFNLENAADKVIYNSLLTKWNGETQYSYTDLRTEIKYIKDVGLKKTMVPLHWLYNYAYMGVTVWDSPTDSLYGKVYPYPLLEVKDSSLFQYDYNNDVGKGTYSYHLKVPASKVTLFYIMQIMQQDLKNVFGYDVVIETREMPVWKLVATPNAQTKLKTKGGKPYYDDGGNSSGGAAGFALTNLPVQSLLDGVMHYIGMGAAPYFDETGITTNIDITIDALLTSWQEVIKALQKNGLDLVAGKKRMKVLIIRDPPSSITTQ